MANRGTMNSANPPASVCWPLGSSAARNSISPPTSTSSISIKARATAGREGQPGAFTNAEFFTKVAENTTGLLQAQTADGFLFRVDVRLRPEGAYGPLVRSLASLETTTPPPARRGNALALIKARPVAGDLALGAELLESLQSFRYPRHPPPSLLAEVAAMKARTEQEMVGSQALGGDVKSGHGGIREIEFITQAFNCCMRAEILSCRRIRPRWRSTSWCVTG